MNHGLVPARLSEPSLGGRAHDGPRAQPSGEFVACNINRVIA